MLSTFFLKTLLLSLERLTQQPNANNERQMRNQGERHDASDVQVCDEGRGGGAAGGANGAGELSGWSRLPAYARLREARGGRGDYSYSRVIFFSR